METKPRKNPRPEMVVYTLSEAMTPTRMEVYKKTADYSLKMHVYEPEGHKPGDRRACAFALHGGGWQGGEPWVFDVFAKFYASLGMVGISAQYRLMGKEPNVTPFECAKDGRSLARYLKANAARMGIDPEKIVASGGSAGAHVAAGTDLFTGVDELTDDLSVSPKPMVMVLFYPVIDTSEAGYGMKKCGEKWRDISPVHQVRPGVAPTLVLASREDTVTPAVGVDRFEEAMKAAGNRCEVLMKPTGPHGYFLYDLGLFEEAKARTAEFLRSCGII